MSTFWQKIQHIDRRWIYLLLGLTLIISLSISKFFKTNIVVNPASRALFDEVQAAPAGPGDGKIIIVGFTFSAGTLGENGNQARAILRHLMLAKKRFAVISISEPQGASFGKLMTQEIADQYGYRYGVDWISFDYQVGTLALYKTLSKDIPLAIQKDGINQQPIGSYEIMRGIKSMKDVAMEIEISASSSLAYWISVVQPSTTPRLKIGYACTGVMATEAYPWLDSKQIVGLLPGLKGAADYEKLTDELEEQLLAKNEIIKPFNIAEAQGVPLPKSARQLMFTQDTAHILIILFILLGNIGLLLSRRAERRVKEEK